MVTVEEVKQGLEQNANIEPAMKEHLMELVTIFHTYFPTVDLTNLKTRLHNLIIEKHNKYVQKEVSHYNAMTNILSFNVDELKKEHDVKHLLMFELLNIITAKEDYTGFNVNHQFEALNVGYAEILTMNMVGNDSDHFYFADQTVLVNMLGEMIGEERFREAFFQNQPMIFLNYLESMGVAL